MYMLPKLFGHSLVSVPAESVTLGGFATEASRSAADSYRSWRTQ